MRRWLRETVEDSALMAILTGVSLASRAQQIYREVQYVGTGIRSLLFPPGDVQGLSERLGYLQGLESAYLAAIDVHGSLQEQFEEYVAALSEVRGQLSAEEGARRAVERGNELLEAQRDRAFAEKGEALRTAAVLTKEVNLLAKRQADGCHKCQEERDAFREQLRIEAEARHRAMEERDAARADRDKERERCAQHYAGRLEATRLLTELRAELATRHAAQELPSVASPGRPK